MTDETNAPARVRWARFRFSIISQLFASPPAAGDLQSAILELAQRQWRHPSTNEVVRISAKTIERWFYMVRHEDNPIVALERKVPSHVGSHRKVSKAADEAIRALRRAHPRWSYQLIYDNLLAIARQDTKLGALPSYPTVCRFMKHHGLLRHRKPRRHELEEGFVPRERRSFEVSHVHALWHSDFHEGKRKVLTANGDRKPVVLFATLDDCSRLCCHAQWYAIDRENTASFVHGLCQGFQKRGLPRALLTDNGSPMLAAETREGLERLSVEQFTTLSQSPEQNGKQEVFWSQVEGRLMAMLDGEKELTLELLNRATQAWIEQEYNRSIHRELGQSPIERCLLGPSVGRPCPSSDALRLAFRMQTSRKQRRSDGTLTVLGIRYEVPPAYRTLLRMTVHVARWDLSCIELMDPRRGTHLATLYPLDKERNADRQRRALDGSTTQSGTHAEPAATGTAPLLRQLMAEYAATGLPPAYVTCNPTKSDDDDTEETEEQ